MPNNRWRDEQKSTWSEVKVTQSCPTHCDPTDYTTHGILHARILEWVAFPSPGNLPKPGIEHRSPTLQVDLPTKPQRNIVEYYSAITGRKFWLITKWMNSEVIMPSEISQSQKDNYYTISLLWGPDTRQSHRDSRISVPSAGWSPHKRILSISLKMKWIITQNSATTVSFQHVS